MRTHGGWLAALSLAMAGCGEPSLLEKCEVVCDHDLACGIEVECDRWTTGCEQLTSASACLDTFDRYYACASADDACNDTCEGTYYEWVLCVVEATP
jgi:hypothetical protein